MGGLYVHPLSRFRRKEYQNLYGPLWTTTSTRLYICSTPYTAIYSAYTMDSGTPAGDPPAEIAVSPVFGVPKASATPVVDSDEELELALPEVEADSPVPGPSAPIAPPGVLEAQTLDPGMKEPDRMHPPSPDFILHQLIPQNQYCPSQLPLPVHSKPPPTPPYPKT
jgi:hypothetical protein